MPINSSSTKVQNQSIKQLVSMLRQLAEALLLLVHLLKLWSEPADLLLVLLSVKLFKSPLFSHILTIQPFSRLESELIGPSPRLQWSSNLGRAKLCYIIPKGISGIPMRLNEAAEQCQVVQLRTETFVRCFTSTCGRWLSTCLWNNESWQQWVNTKSRIYIYIYIYIYYFLCILI